MRTILSLPGNEALAHQLAQRLGAGMTPLEWRRFPDGEAYLRLHGDLSGAHVIIVCTLTDPDPKMLSLLFAARTARELGAVKITLVAPYLAYMRQDKAFNSGEAVTSRCFADLLSQAFDDLVTVDPHLHRYATLSEIYSIPTRVLHAAPLIGRWISAHVRHPLVIGPDEESEQWAGDIASVSAAPVAVLHKTRLGDRQVEISLPDMANFRDYTPVLVDDIVSSGETMLAVARQLAAQGFAKPVCIAVHAIFAGESYNALAKLSERVVSTDAVPHPSNAIALADLIAQGISIP